MTHKTRVFHAFGKRHDFNSASCMSQHIPANGASTEILFPRGKFLVKVLRANYQAPKEKQPFSMHQYISIHTAREAGPDFYLAVTTEP